MHNQGYNSFKRMGPRANETEITQTDKTFVLQILTTNHKPENSPIKRSRRMEPDQVEVIFKTSAI